ncbi:MAG TPA: hypothetical protein VM033_03660 [Gemmatimonadaceae bacterium]|nr:hypothetical protein [Gemmatimonadaceae bacterium]
MTIGAMVERERRYARRQELSAAALLVAGAASIVIGLGAMLLGDARWLALPRAVPFVVWVVVGGTSLAVAGRTRRRLRAGGTRALVARAIEHEQGLRRGLLVGAIELEGEGALAARAASAARAALPDRAPLAPAMRRAGARRTVAGAGVAVAGVLVLASATPLFGDGLRAVLRPIDAWRGVLLARPRIEGAPHDLLRGAPLSIVVRAPGRARVVLSVRQIGEPWRTDTLVVDASGIARWKLAALRTDVRLVATDGRVDSDSVVVHAADRPFLGAVSLRLTYPDYLGRPAETVPLGEPLRLPRGTALDVTGRASVPLQSVSLTEPGHQTFALAPAGHDFAGRLLALRSMQLRWHATAAGGAAPDLPPPLDITVLADSAPRVEILEPTSDTIRVVGQSIALAVTASDDHGLANVALRVSRSGTASTAQALSVSGGTSWSGTASLDVAVLELRSGESMRVRAEAVDASPWAQRGVSREIVVRRATSEEVREGVRALGDSAVEEARAAASAQRALAQRTDEAARAQGRRGNRASAPSGSGSSGAPPPAPGNMSFESAEKARALAQEQRAMTERVQKLQQATQHLEQQLRAAGALDTALARQLGEAQALLRQALTPQMQAQMQTLERAAQQLNGEQSRDALRDLAQMQQRMREQLERSAEMLKRAAHEGAMQTLGDQARELAAQERALADSASRAPAGPQHDARDAAQLAERTERMRQQMERLADRLARDRADAGATRTAQAADHAAKAETGMRRAANELRAGGSRTGEKTGEERRGDAERARDAASEMDRAAKAMQDARADQVREWKQELTTELDRAVQEMMQLAREERALEQKARSGSPQEDRRSAQSAVEQGVDKTSERLQGAGKKTALLSPRSQRAVADAKEKVSQATRSVSESRGNASPRQAGALGDAADALTRAAAALARDRERANSASSASGFSEMLQQLQDAAQKQGQINSQALGLMAMPNGQSGAGQALSRELARRQRGVADQLEDAGNATGGDRADQLAREARQLADALEGGRLDPGTLARQQQLFRRLLDAGRSLEKEEREDTGKREAKSASASDTFTPGATVDAKAAQRFRPPTWEELRALSPDERRAIMEYFTRLNRAPAP